MICTFFLFTNILLHLSRSYLELHEQERESEIVVILLCTCVFVLHDIKSPNRTNTLPVLDNENKPTSFYMNLV